MEFIVNKKKYNSIPFEFETMCQLEERGIEAQDLGNKKTLTTLRTYFSLCSGLPDEVASAEINRHIVGGGNLAELTAVMNKEMNDSAFIQAVLNQVEEEPQTVPQTQVAPQTTPQPQIQTVTPQVVQAVTTEV